MLAKLSNADLIGFLMLIGCVATFSVLIARMVAPH